MNDFSVSQKIGDATIMCADAMDIMRGMVKAGAGVDCIVTDPPYKLTSGGPSGLLRGAFDPEIYDNSGSIVQCDIDWPDFMPLLFQVLLPDSHAYVMANNRNVEAMLCEATKAGFRFHNLLVWDKITATPNRWYMKNCEFIGFFFKGTAKMIADCSAKQLIRCPQKDVTGHPTEKPVALMENFIRQSTKEGDMVFDPFMGTGTTGVAAANAKRRFLGIEIDESHFHTASGRLRNPTRQQSII